MFDHAGLTLRGPRNRNPPQVADVRSIEPLLNELQQAGISVALQKRSGQIFAAGVPCVVPVGDILRSTFEAEKLKHSLLHFVRNEVPLTLSLVQLNQYASAHKSLQLFCEFLARSLASERYRATNIGLCLSSHQLPLQTFMVVTNSILGSGPRYVYLDGLQMKYHCNGQVQRETERNWRFLWQQRHAVQRILPVYGGLVRSACPLLSDETAGAILPGTATVVPQRSAWLPIDICLAGYLRDDGQMDWTRLSPALQKTVRVGEKLLGELAWSCRRQSADARAHRRLAISISGIGELVLRSGRSPGSLECLTWLSEVIKRIRAELQACSAVLAQELGALPAVLCADPSAGLKAGAARDNWRQRWNSAVRSSALRHRNLLVLSPYSVLPEKADQSADFCDLLPIIRYADAWCFSTTAALADWSIHDYQRFHRRAWALIQGHNEGCVVAAGV
jgi:hypothetical protein